MQVSTEKFIRQPGLHLTRLRLESSVEIAVQINGKTKGTLSIGKDDAKEDVIAKAKEAIADKLTGNIVKEIYVPGRIVNIVMR